jgi:hypothetical protein
MTRKITSFNLDKSVGKLAKPSVFDQIVKEIEATEIPAKYVEQILVQYHDGNIVELNKAEISQPIPLNKDASWEAMEDEFKKMKDVKVFINIDDLEKDINVLVENILGNHC